MVGKVLDQKGYLFFQPWVVNNHHLDFWHVLMILPKLKMAVGFFLTLQTLQKAGGSRHQIVVAKNQR